MLRNARLASLVGLFILGTVLPINAQTLTEVVRRVKPAIVSIYTQENGEYELNGSGFFVDPYHVVTSWHVVDDTCNVQVRTSDGRKFDVKGITAKDEKADVVNLALTAPNNSIRPLRVSARAPEEGERIVVIGSPAGLEFTVSDGIISAVRQRPGVGRVIQLTAPVSPGSSGSPVVNMNGEVVGLVVQTLQGAQNINLAVSTQQILALRPGSTMALCPSTPAGAGAGPSTASLSGIVSMINDGNYSGALSRANQILRNDPSNSKAWYLAGYSYMMMDQDQAAVTAFSKAITLDPQFQAAYRELGIALGAVGDMDKAITAFKAAIALDPEDSIAHFGLGAAYAVNGDRRAALAEYNILKSLDQELAGKLFGIIYGQEG